MAERHFLIKTMALFIEQLMDDAAKRVDENREIFTTLYSLRPLVEKSVGLALVNIDTVNCFDDTLLRRVELQITHQHGRIACLFLVADSDWQDYYHRVVTLLEGLLVSRAAFREGKPTMLREAVQGFMVDFSRIGFTERDQLYLKRGEHSYMFHIVERG